MQRQTIILFMTAVLGSTALHGQSDHYYAPFHRQTKDSTQIIVSKFGHYASVGLGGASAKGQGGLNKLVSYSVAYKSHVLALTAMSAGPINFGGGDRLPNIFTSYYGILIGESIRMENLLISISAGVSHTNTSVKYPNPNATSPSNEFSHYSKYGISYPIELKIFYVAHNGVGFGLHVSKNGSPFYWGISMVFGKWNKSKVKN